jgi:hypothetical protein
MKISINYLLVAGLFASQIFLVNCDSKTNKAVHALMPNSKVNTDSLPPCNDKVMPLITERKTLVDDLNSKIKDAKAHDLTTAQKAELNKAVDDLKAKSNQVYDAMTAIKGGAAGCNSVTTDGKKAPYSIALMKKENLDLANQVKALTKESNALTMSDEDLNKTTVIENQSYNVKAELAKEMTKDKVEAVYIVDGKINSGDTAREELPEMLSKKDRSFCYLAVSDGETKDSDELKVMSLRSIESADGKSASSILIFVTNGDQINKFNCVSLNVSDVPTEIRNIFGELLILKNGISQQPDSTQK